MVKYVKQYRCGVEGVREIVGRGREAYVDEALCTQFLMRLQEGRVLTREELEELLREGKNRFVLLRRVR